LRSFLIAFTCAIVPDRCNLECFGFFGYRQSEIPKAHIPVRTFICPAIVPDRCDLERLCIA